MVEGRRFNCAALECSLSDDSEPLYCLNRKGGVLTKQPAFEPIDGCAQPHPGFRRRDEYANQSDNDSDNCHTHTHEGEHVLFGPGLATSSGDGCAWVASNK